MLALSGSLGVACVGTKIITIKHTNLDGNSEYFVCEGGEGKTCGGEREGQMDPDGYQDRVEIHSPPKGCINGAATIEVVLAGSEVKRVRYECAQPPLSGGLPAGVAGGAGELEPPGPGTGLPPSAPAPGLPPSVDTSSGGTGARP